MKTSKIVVRSKLIEFIWSLFGVVISISLSATLLDLATNMQELDQAIFLALYSGVFLCAVILFTGITIEHWQDYLLHRDIRRDETKEIAELNEDIPYYQPFGKHKKVKKGRKTYDYKKTDNNYPLGL